MFRIETFVPDIAMFLILLLFGIVAIGIALVITAFAGSSYMAATLSSLVITSTCMLGGCFWPVDLMPEVVQKISFFMPQQWAIDAFQKVQLGSGMYEILINTMILCAFALALLLIAIYKFYRADDVKKFV